MNEQDLRDCFAMFAMAGLIMRGGDLDINQVWDIADKMLAGRTPKEEIGITAIKRTRKKAND
jgi:hypothetical protein